MEFSGKRKRIPGQVFMPEMLRGAGVLCVAGILLAFSTATRAEINVSYTYDAMGRIVSIIYSDGSKTTTATYSYDASGNRTSVVTK